jgi:hypothetical protein
MINQILNSKQDTSLWSREKISFRSTDVENWSFTHEMIRFRCAKREERDSIRIKDKKYRNHVGNKLQIAWIYLLWQWKTFVVIMQLLLLLIFAPCKSVSRMENDTDVAWRRRSGNEKRLPILPRFPRPQYILSRCELVFGISC